MFRPTALWTSFATLGLTLGFVANARAQYRPQLLPDQAEETNPLYFKELAKARFVVTQADPKELAKAKLEAARGEYQSRYKEYEAGRGTLDLLLGSSLRLLDSERALSEEPADQVVAYEKHWARTKRIETINEGTYKAGRIPLKEYLRSKYSRLQAESWLAQAKAKTEKPRLSSESPRIPEGLLSSKELARDKLGATEVKSVDDPLPSLYEKNHAKDKFKASQSDPKGVAKNMLKEVAQFVCDARFREFLAGRGSLDILIDSTRRSLDSELALCENPADETAAYETYWMRIQRIEMATRDRYEAGRLPNQEYLQSKYHLLQAEIWLIEATAKKAGK